MTDNDGACDRARVHVIEGATDMSMPDISDWRRTCPLDTLDKVVHLMKESYFRDSYMEIAEPRILAWIKKDFGAFEVNKSDWRGKTLLNRAIRYHFCKVVVLLLSHPDIDVNDLDCENRTALVRSWGDFDENPGALALLYDPRTKRSHPERGTLWSMMSWGKMHNIKQWIASGYALEYDTNRKSDDPMTWGRPYRDVNIQPVRRLVQRYFSDPAKVVHETRLELGWYDMRAADYFALIDSLVNRVHVCKEGEETQATRFFSMALRLPIELQRILCLRLAGSPKDHIVADSVKQGASRLKELLKIVSV